MRIYIDTSVINGLYVEDTIWIKEMTKEFFKRVKNRYKLFISDIVADEIKRTPDPVKQENLLAVVKKFNCTELKKTQEAEIMANGYNRGQDNTF